MAKQSSEFERIVISRENVERFVRENLPGFEIKPVAGDGLCILSSFSTAWSATTGIECCNEEAIANLRGELLNRYSFYKEFSPENVDILKELQQFLLSPLTYYNSATSDLFLLALGNAYKCNIIVFQSDEEKCWICDFSDNNNSYEITLHFARTLSPHIDPIIPEKYLKKDEILSENENSEFETTPPDGSNASNMDECNQNYEIFEIRSESDEGNETTEDSDSEIMITAVYPGSPNRTNVIKQEEGFLSSQEGESSYSEDNSMIIDHQGNKVLGEDAWYGIEVEDTNQLPGDINGMKVYQVKANSRPELLQKCRDGRPWKKDNKTKWLRYENVRYKDCSGSLFCPNPDCQYALEYGEQNRLRFDKTKCCMLCGAFGENKYCPARRYTAYIGDKAAKIFHYGIHTCQASTVTIRPKQMVSAAIDADTNVKPSQIQGNAILSAMRKKKPWSDIEKVAKQVVDKKAISNEKIKQRKQLYPFGENFVALAEYKSYTDEKDKLLIYKIDENEQFVFKTSKQKMKIAHDMCDCNKEMLSNQYCYFDGKVGRCKNFVTLTASTYHPILQKQVSLAIMECKCEDSKSVEKFWKVFNLAFKDANNTLEKFNPIGWVSDMAACNFNGLQMIYGEEILEKIKGCEFHYKQSINRHSSKFENPEEFKELAKNLLLASTKAAYTDAYNKLEAFTNMSTNGELLKHWLKWWHDRREYICRAFNDITCPQANQAEVIHAGWTNRSETGLSLCQAAEFDTKDAVILEQEIEEVKTARRGRGVGPTFTELQKRKRSREVSTFAKKGKDLIDFGLDESLSKRSFPFDASSGCDVNKRNSNESQLFNTRLNTAIEAASKMKIRSYKNVNKCKRTFSVAASEASRMQYNVVISNVSSCSCRDYLKNGKNVVCKHIIFVFYFALKGEKCLNLLRERFINDDDLQKLFRNVGDSINSDYVQQKKTKSPCDFQSLLKSHPLSSQPQLWNAHKKQKRTAKCSNWSCRKVLAVGSSCFSVEGALTVPYNASKAVQQKFFFCFKKSCLNPPPWTNIHKLECVENLTVDDSMQSEQDEVLRILDIPIARN